jgi:hypothetical protein
MKKIILLALISAFALVSFANNDTIPLPKDKVEKIVEEPYTNTKGKTSTKYFVIFKNKNGKKKMAEINKSDFNKLEQAKKYSLDVDYFLVISKTKTKLIVK